MHELTCRGNCTVAYVRHVRDFGLFGTFLYGELRVVALDLHVGQQAVDEVHGDFVVAEVVRVSTTVDRLQSTHVELVTFALLETVVAREAEGIVLGDGLRKYKLTSRRFNKQTAICFLGTRYLFSLEICTFARKRRCISGT